MIGFREFGQQPFHLVLFQRHVDFDSRMARDRGGNTRANLLQVQRLLFAGELIEQFVKHVFDRRGLHSRGSDFDGDTAHAEWLGLETVARELVGNFAEDRLLRRRQFQHDRHQQALALDSHRRPPLQHALEKYTLVSHVLVYDPQAIFVYREDEGVANLAQWLERAKSGESGLLFADVEGRRTSVVRNRVELLPRKSRGEIWIERSRLQS